MPGRTREATKCECSLRARTEKEGTRDCGRREGQKAAPLSTFQPHAAGKAIDRENLPGKPPSPPNPFWPLLLAICPHCPPQEAATVLQVRPKFTFFAIFPHRVPFSHDIFLSFFFFFSLLSCSRAIISARLLGRMKEPG